MSLIASCQQCSWQEVVSDRPTVADLAIAGELCREHADAEHFTLRSPDHADRSLA